jgi:osmoprotectant transport system ATP-binding protein
LKAVRFDAVTVRYPRADRNAVDGVSAEAPSGKFTVLVGPSGCGKSTLLRTVNRLVFPQSGEVYVGDEAVSAQDPIALRRGIGYVIQAVGLFAHMTVAQNIAVVPSLLHWDRERIETRIDDLLQLVGLDAQRYRNRYPRELSGGEQQRVGVARAIAAQPPVLLMDEPFGAVDAIVRRSLQTEIRRIASSLQTTILFVTHDVDEALRLADQIVVMNQGRIEQQGTPEEMLANPATPYVRQLFAIDSELRRYDALRGAL